MKEKNTKTSLFPAQECIAPSIPSSSITASTLHPCGYLLLPSLAHNLPSPLACLPAHSPECVLCRKARLPIHPPLIKDIINIQPSIINPSHLVSFRPVPSCPVLVIPHL